MKDGFSKHHEQIWLGLQLCKAGHEITSAMMYKMLLIKIYLLFLSLNIISWCSTLLYKHFLSGNIFSMIVILTSDTKKDRLFFSQVFFCNLCCQDLFFYTFYYNLVFHYLCLIFMKTVHFFYIVNSSQSNNWLFLWLLSFVCLNAKDIHGFL